jgi:hypothetical protein
MLHTDIVQTTDRYRLTDDDNETRMLIVVEEILSKDKQQLDDRYIRMSFTSSFSRLIVGRFVEQTKWPIKFVKRHHSNVVASMRSKASEQILLNECT